MVELPDHYAEVVSPRPDACFRVVHVPVGTPRAGTPMRCPEVPRWVGLNAALGHAAVRVVAGDRHVGPLRARRAWPGESAEPVGPLGPAPRHRRGP